MPDLFCELSWDKLCPKANASLMVEVLDDADGGGGGPLILIDHYPKDSVRLHKGPKQWTETGV